MKKKYVVLSIITLVLLITFVTSFNYFKTSNTYVENNSNNQTKITKGISMNLEQTAGAGDYKQVTQSNWPGDDYAFNAELSKCENGSTLSWDNTKNVVVFSGNVSDKCYVYFDKYVLPVINDVTVEVAYTSVHVKVDASEGSNKIEGYYYYLGQRPVKLNGNNEYTYTNLTPGNHPISIIIRVRDTKGKFSIAYEKKITLSDLTLINYVKSQYTGTQGKNNIYYHDSSLANGAGDNSYRYAGASDSVNNYICLGSDATTCPDANLFRIIGVFGDKTKVIRAKSVGYQQWHTSADNTWSSSSLNAYLNGTYLTSLGTIAEKIATTTWKVGGGSGSNISASVPKTAYKNEVGSSASTTIIDKKIGLMYVSDYGFAASPSAWTKTLGDYDGTDANGTSIKTINWMYMGYNEWTISRSSDLTNHSFRVHSSGFVRYDHVTSSFEVRPSFNLESSVKYVSGSGSMSDPVRVN
ncbi:MAG: hypothetical protein U0M92_02685 [Bacilli bacterium]